MALETIQAETEKLNVRKKIEVACLDAESDTNFKILTEIKVMLNSVYGEERNQITKPTYDSVYERLKESGMWPAVKERILTIQESRIYDYLNSLSIDCVSYQIVIHFPEITIKNDTNKHLIRNIYVRLFLRPSGLIRASIQGMRTTVTEAEFMSRYIHSHLPRLNPHVITFHNFCTGVGEINLVLALLNNKYTSANFMVLLMHIKNYLEWESKEGAPYMFMENIFARNDSIDVHNVLPNSSATTASNNIIDNMIDELTISDVMKLLCFHVTERAIIVKSTNEFEKWVGEKITKWDRVMLGRLSSAAFLCLRDNMGEYFSISTPERDITYEQESILNFKGRNIKFEVIEKSQKNLNEIVANPKITKKACEKLSQELTRIALSSAGIKSGSSLIYNTELAEPDKVSL